MEWVASWRCPLPLHKTIGNKKCKQSTGSWMAEVGQDESHPTLGAYLPRLYINSRIFTIWNHSSVTEDWPQKLVLSSFHWRWKNYRTTSAPPGIQAFPWHPCQKKLSIFSTVCACNIIWQQSSFWSALSNFSRKACMERFSLNDKSLAKGTVKECFPFLIWEGCHSNSRHSCSFAFFIKGVSVHPSIGQRC